MLLDFIKRKFSFRKDEIKNKIDDQVYLEPINNKEASLIEKQNCALPFFNEQQTVVDVVDKEDNCNIELMTKANNVDKNATMIPDWAKSWIKIEKDEVNIIKEKNFKENETEIINNPENLSQTQTAGKNKELVEPRNVEIREMVLRQIQMSRKTARYMCSTEDLVEEQIQKAMKRGEFNKLKGKGKPIIYEEYPFEDPSLRLPFKILKNAGFAPYWIELGKEIDADISTCNMFMQKFLDNLAYRKERYGNIKGSPDIENRKRDLMKMCTDKLKEANKKIDKYNLIVPGYWLQKKKIDIDEQIDNFQKKLNEF